MENDVVSFIYEFYEEDGTIVNTALIRDISRQIMAGHPKWPDEQVEGCVSLVLRSEYGYFHSGEEDSEEAERDLVLRNNFVHGHKIGED